MYIYKKKMGIFSLLVVSLLFITGFAPVQQMNPEDEDITIRITQVDTSEFPEVTVYVSVVNAEGEPVGVEASRLELKENNKVIAHDQLQGIGEVRKLTTMLVMDVSGSMNSAGKLEAAKAVARDYVNQMRHDDQAGLLVFNTEIDYVQAITSDHHELINAIDSLEAMDDTAMYDGLMLAVDILEPISGRKAIIVLTDGLDNRSTSTPEDVIQNIGYGGLSISTVGLGDPSQGPGVLSAIDEDVLISLADNAGGRYGYAEDEQALRELYDLYSRTLQSEYVITYTSPSNLRDGVNRALIVSLSPETGLNEQSVEQTDQITYNPGGLVPEVAEPAHWPLFLILLGGLLVLLFIPAFVSGLTRLISGSGKGKRRFFKKRPRIKLKD